MTREESYLVKTVVGHLRHIRDEWNQNVDLNMVIRDSTILRLLLVEGHLQKAWKACGYTFPIRIRAIDLSQITNAYERGRILAAFAGGALHYGTRWALGIFFETGAQTAAPSRKSPQLAEFKLSDYVSAPCMTVRELDTSRGELIKYVTNKLGGAHIDFKRSVSKPLEKKFAYLDSLHGYEQVDRNIVPYQLLSIGTELMGSNHIQRLMKRQV